MVINNDSRMSHDIVLKNSEKNSPTQNPKTRPERLLGCSWEAHVNQLLPRRVKLCQFICFNHSFSSREGPKRYEKSDKTNLYVFFSHAMIWSHRMRELFDWSTQLRIKIILRTVLAALLVFLVVIPGNWLNDSGLNPNLWSQKNLTQFWKRPLNSTPRLAELRLSPNHFLFDYLWDERNMIVVDCRKNCVPCQFVPRLLHLAVSVDCRQFAFNRQGCIEGEEK